MKLIYFTILTSYFLGGSLLYSMTEKSFQEIWEELHTMHFGPGGIIEPQVNLQDLKNALNAETDIDLNKPIGHSKYLPLIEAIKWLNPNEVRLLLDYGANPNLKGQYGDTPLLHTVRSLINAYSSIHPADESKRPILKTILLELLKVPSIDILAKYKFGATVLDLLKEEFNRLMSQVREPINNVKETARLILDHLIKQKEFEGFKRPFKEYLVSQGIPPELVEQYIFEFAKK